MNKSNSILILLISLLIVTSANAQRWKRYRYDFQYGIGTSNFMGDLGGADGKASMFSTDLDPQTTKPTIYVAMRYKVQERVSFKANIILGGIAGADEYSNSSRTGRNISFKSVLGETSLQAEYHIIKEKTGRRYAFKSRKKIQLVGINTYIFAGIGAAFFNPKGQKDGVWYPLYDKHTEGQGLEGGPEQYSRVTAVFPLGFGVKYNISRKLSLGLEYGFRYTLTDYMDDTSDKYYDNEALRTAYGDEAAYFGDPRDGAKVPGGTDWRGNPKTNDAYMFMLVHLSYKLRVTRRGLPKF